jgi:hypothetical protein
MGEQAPARPLAEFEAQFGVDDIIRERREGHQVLTVVNYVSDRPDTPHWVIVEKVGNGRIVRESDGAVLIDGPYVVIGDPARGTSVALPREDFERHWVPESTIIASKGHLATATVDASPTHESALPASSSLDRDSVVLPPPGSPAPPSSSPSSRSRLAVAARECTALKKIGVVRQLGQRNMENVVLVDTPEGTQLWVNPEYSDYRGAWEAATGQPIASGFDVDHVQNKARATQQGYAYVRLLLVDSTANQGTGRNWEKAVAALGRKGFVEPDLPPIRYADPVQRAKIIGFDSGPKSKGFPGVQEYGRQHGFK